MRYLFYILLLSLVFNLCGTTQLLAQIKVQQEDGNGVVVNADPRLELITAFLKSKNKTNIASANNGEAKSSGFIRSGKGFRIQLYNGNEREEANAKKIAFVRKYPNIRTYLTYIQPQFRLKVGNFTTRAEAQKFANQLYQDFSPLMIVPDIVEINSFKNETAN